MTRFERVMAVTLFAVPLSGAWLIPREIASYFRDAAERSEARQRQGGPIDSFPFRHEQQKFERITKEHDDFVRALTAVLQGAFELSEHEVQRNRLLVSEQVLVGVHRTSAREEQARQLARSRTRDLEFVWATFLTRGMEQGAIPEADPRMLARAILGLYNSVFHWYRPGGDLALADVADFYVRRCLAVAGLPMDVVGAGARPRKAKAASRSRAASR